MHLLAALDDGEGVDEGSPLVIRQCHRLSVRYPQMNSAATRVHPEQVLVAKLLSYGRVEHTDRSADEAPAAFADVRTRTACSDAIVVRHVDVKNELPLNGRERGRPHGLLVPGLLKKHKNEKDPPIRERDISGATRGFTGTHALVLCRRGRSRSGSDSACTPAS